MEGSTLSRLEQVSKKPWFVAVYRWAAVILIPFAIPTVVAMIVWLMSSVNTAQSSIATIDAKVSSVIQRVDSLETANQNALAERLQDTKSNAALTVSISSRLTALETNNENLTNAVNRLVKLLDERLPAAPRQSSQ